MKELFGVLNLLDPNEWGDEDEFFERYGGAQGQQQQPRVEQIQALQVRDCGNPL